MYMCIVYHNLIYSICCILDITPYTHGAHNHWRDVYTATASSQCRHSFPWIWGMIHLLDSELLLPGVSLPKPWKGAAALAAGLYNQRKEYQLSSAMKE